MNQCHIDSFYIGIILKKNYNTLTVPGEKWKMVAVGSWIMKSIVVNAGRSQA